MAKGRNIDFLVHMKNEENFESNVLNDDTNLWRKYDINKNCYQYILLTKQLPENIARALCNN